MSVPSKYDLELVASIAARFLRPRQKNTIDSRDYTNAAKLALKFLHACDQAIDADYRERCGFQEEGKLLGWKDAVTKITGTKNAYKALQKYRAYLIAREHDELQLPESMGDQDQSNSAVEVIRGPERTIEMLIKGFKEKGASQLSVDLESARLAVWKEKSTHEGRSKAGKASAECRRKKRQKKHFGED